MVFRTPQQKKTKSYVYYTGVGAKPSGHHTTAEFLEIMKSITANDATHATLFKTYTLKNWLVYSGAIVRKKTLKATHAA